LPEELEAGLSRHFRNVALRRQHDWIGSAILDDADTRAEELAPLEAMQVAKALSTEPGTEPYTIAVAGHSALPDPRPRMVLTGLVEVRKWLELWNQQQEVLAGQHEHFQNLDSHWRELGAMREELRKSEAELSRVVELEQRCEELTRERDVTKQQAAELAKRIDQLQTTAHAVYSSVSWRITRPVRSIKRITRGR
jgi:hypothetical protein